MASDDRRPAMPEEGDSPFPPSPPEPTTALPGHPDAKLWHSLYPKDDSVVQLASVLPGDEEGMLEVFPGDEIDLIPVQRVQKPPFPGFWFSALSCLVFAVITNGTMIGITIVVFVGMAFASGNPKDFFETAVPKPAKKEAPFDEVKDHAGEEVDFTSMNFPKPFMDALGVGLLVAEIVSVFVAWLTVRLIVGKDWPRQLALKRPSGIHVLLAVLSFPAFVILPGPIGELARKFLPTMMGEGNEGGEIFGKLPVWLSILAIGVGPGIGEELWCRGLLGRGLVGRYGVTVGILLTSFFFGILHLDPAYAFVTACMGIWLHYVYWATRSLWLSMFLHFMNNTTGVLLMHYQLGKDLEKVPISIFYGAAVLMASIAVALYTSRARLAPAGEDNRAPWQPDFSGVAYPPAGSGTVVFRPWPGWLASSLVVLSIGGMVGVFYWAS